MAEVDVVRTVFQSEWIGGGAVAQMIRQYGLAEKAIGQLGASGGKGGAALGAGLDVAGAKANIATRELARLSHEVAMGEKSFATAALEGGKYNTMLDESSVSAGGLLSKLSPLTIGIGALAAAVVGAVVAFKTLYPVLEAGAEVAQLDNSFANLNRSIGASSDLLDQMKNASQGTVSTMAAQEGYMTLVAGSSDDMALALADAAPRLLEISKAANKLNPALGDTNFLFTSLAKGVKRAEPRLIDNLGLKLRVADANRTLAAELGKSVLELTAEEKQLAILNETLRAGGQLIAQVGGSVDGLGDSFQRVSASTTTLKDELRQNLFLSFSTDRLDSYASSLGNLGKTISRENVFINALADGIIDANKAMEFRQELWRGDAEQTKRNIDFIERRRQALIDEKIATQEATQAELDRLSALYGTSPEVPQREPVVPTTDLEFDDRRLGSKDYEREAARRDRARLAGEQEAKDRDELVKALDKAQKEEAAIFNKALSAANEWADGINTASQEARDAWIAYTAELGATAKEMADADAESSLFTTSIMAIGDGWRETGGATEEQIELIEDLQDAYDKADKTVSDLRSGIKGFGQDEEKTAEQIEKNLAAMDHYKAKIDGVAVAETELVRTHQEAAWNWDNVRTALGAAAEEAGIGAIGFAKMRVAMGEMTDEQAIAVLQATAMQTRIEELGRAMTEAGGGMSFESAWRELQAFETELANKDFSILLKPTIDTEDEGTFVDAATRRLDEKLARMEGEDGVKIPVGADTESAQNTLIEEFFGEGALEPAIITAVVDHDEATNQLALWRTEQGKEPVRIPVEMIFPDSPGIPGGYNPLPGKAGGGNMMAGHMALVGEQGPELIVPGSNSTAIPNNKLGAGGNGVNITINVNGDGGDGLAMIVQDSLLEAMQQVGIL
jgi:hypothetical protein